MSSTGRKFAATSSALVSPSACIATRALSRMRAWTWSTHWSGSVVALDLMAADKAWDERYLVTSSR
jgi:hypothetical protein